ncbi:unnamed protein product [Rotaria magnacalcarata]|uniref:OTU domain-containing protein n=1 Tax=Rotaria magnacalcarata TaxID=392030 RepID=A0A816PZF9_9BILA|nr:unnamed protein product [Rotaria magnacalcarata]CAF3874478.1 unnamed protein product [Rotaria magnacalcarata]
MAQRTVFSSIVNTTDDSSPRSTKTYDALRPHYYTSFQNYCCGPKSNPTTSSQIKDVLPIPEKFKIEAKDLLTRINCFLIENLHEVTKYTSVLPNTFVEKTDHVDNQRYLIDRAMFRMMNGAQIINWSSSLPMLYPIRTSGNGNCLLHAVLIAMLGIHDLNLYLRDRLVQFMDENKEILKNHWRIERLKSDEKYGINSEDSKLDEEWNELCNLVRYENTEDGQTATQLQYLEAVHIFSISNMLCRPIIVLSEDWIRNKIGEAISVNDLYGIYLPTLSPSLECSTEPIVLAYDRSHFCALITRDIGHSKSSKDLLPLYLSVNHAYDGMSLPIRFLGEDGSVEYSNNLLDEYLRVKKIDYSFDSNSSSLSILCTELGSKHLLPKDSFFTLFQKYLNDFFEVQKPKSIADQKKREKQHELDKHVARDLCSDDKSLSTIQQLPSLSSSLSPRVRSNATSYDILSHNQDNGSYEQRYVYDGTYADQSNVPHTSTFYIENPVYKSQQSPRPSEHVEVLREATGLYTTDIEPSKQSYFDNNTSNISNLNSYDKYFNTDNLPLREDESKHRRERPQQQNVINSPVRYIAPRIVSMNRTPVISAERHLTTDKCIICNRSSNDVKSNYICSKCEREQHLHTSQYDASNRPFSQLRRTNLYLTGDNFRSPSTLSSIPKIKTRRMIVCPNCKNTNMNYTSNSSNYSCSACRQTIAPEYLYY